MAADDASVSSVDLAEADVDTTVNNPDILTKFKAAGTIAQEAIAFVQSLCIVGARVGEICAAGDAKIDELCSKVYNKKVDGKVVKKGVAFPVCVSRNTCLGHNSPFVGLEGVADELIAEGDVVKIDLGVHIDGCPALVATTLFAGAAAPTERTADVIVGAHTALQAAVRMLTEGQLSSGITANIERIAAAYGVAPMQGILSHEVARWVIDGTNCFACKHKVEEAPKPFAVANAKVYTVDIVLSTGEGVSRQIDARTTIYKRNVDNKYALKMKAARAVASEVSKRFPALPFTLRALTVEAKSAKLGVSEMVQHKVLEPYPVLFEYDGAAVAQFKATVVITAAGNAMVIAATALPAGVVSTRAVAEEDLVAILARDLNKKKKKKAAAGAAGAPAAE